MSDTLMTRRAPPLPLPLSAPKASTVVLVLTGIAGIGVAVAAGSAGFLQLYVQKAVVNFDWELCLQASMLFAFVGGVLCLAQQQIGVPLVIGASSTMVATVATTLASPSLSVSRMLDAVPIRGALLLAGGAAGVVGIGVGIAGLRGRRSLGFVIPVVALVMATLVATAAFFRIDDDPNGSSVRPFLGFAFIAVVGVVCSFIGRRGVLVAATGSATIVTTFIHLLDGRFHEREAPLQLGIVTIGLTVAVAIAGASVVARRSDEPVYGSVWASPGAVGTAAGSTPLEPTKFAPSATVGDPVSSSPSAMGQWAADPYGRYPLRYWDGVNWTENVRTSAGDTSADPV